jgi:hypothetical protein
VLGFFCTLTTAAERIKIQNSLWSHQSAMSKGKLSTRPSEIRHSPNCHSGSTALIKVLKPSTVQMGNCRRNQSTLLIAAGYAESISLEKLSTSTGA